MRQFGFTIVLWNMRIGSIYFIFASQFPLVITRLCPDFHGINEE